MSNHKIIFLVTENSENHQLECYYNDNDEIFISIDIGYNEITDWITLDKATAIKLVRVLKAEISKIQ